MKTLYSDIDRWQSSHQLSLGARTSTPGQGHEQRQVPLEQYKSLMDDEQWTPTDRRVSSTSVKHQLGYDTTLCLKKTTLVLHTITSMHINQFWQFLAEMLLREYAIKGDLLSYLS